MKSRKIKLVAGAICREFTLIGIGWSQQTSSFLIVVLNLFIGIQIKRTYKRKSYGK